MWSRAFVNGTSFFRVCEKHNQVSSFSKRTFLPLTVFSDFPFCFIFSVVEKCLNLELTEKRESHTI